MTRRRFRFCVLAFLISFLFVACVERPDLSGRFVRSERGVTRDEALVFNPDRRFEQLPVIPDGVEANAGTFTLTRDSLILQFDDHQIPAPSPVKIDRRSKIDDSAIVYVRGIDGRTGRAIRSVRTSLLDSAGRTLFSISHGHSTTTTINVSPEAGVDRLSMSYHFAGTADISAAPLFGYESRVTARFFSNTDSVRVRGRRAAYGFRYHRNSDSFDLSSGHAAWTYVGDAN